MMRDLKNLTVYIKIDYIIIYITKESSFVVKNLDTGEEIDVRDESHIEIILS
jgi:hypothetical protein